MPEGNSIDTELLNGIVTHESRMVGLIDLHAVVSGARSSTADVGVQERQRKRALRRPFAFPALCLR